MILKHCPNNYSGILTLCAARRACARARVCECVCECTCCVSGAAGQRRMAENRIFCPFFTDRPGSAHFELLEYERGSPFCLLATTHKIRFRGTTEVQVSQSASPIGHVNLFAYSYNVRTGMQLASKRACV